MISPDGPIVLFVVHPRQINPAMLLGVGHRLACAPIGTAFQIQFAIGAVLTDWIKTGNGPDGAITCVSKGEAKR